MKFSKKIEFSWAGGRARARVRVVKVFFLENESRSGLNPTRATREPGLPATRVQSRRVRTDLTGFDPSDFFKPLNANDTNSQLLASQN